MTRFDNALAYYKTNYNKLHEAFLEFLSVPSISAAEEHKTDIQNAADYLVVKLQEMNFSNVKAYPTSRHPIVYGERLPNGDKPTVLLYGHYDVQPPDPIEQWDSAPFEPSIRGDYLFARGASDMKH